MNDRVIVNLDLTMEEYNGLTNAIMLFGRDKDTTSHGRDIMDALRGKIQKGAKRNQL